MKFKKYLASLILCGLTWILGMIFMFSTIVNEGSDVLMSVFGVLMLGGMIAFVPLLILTIKAYPAFKQACQNGSQPKDASKWSFIGLITAGVGLLIALLIFGISGTVYGKVYFFDGYAYTGMLWILSAILLVVGLSMLFVSAQKLNKRADKTAHLLNRLWNNKIVVIILSVLVLFVSILISSGDMLLCVIISEVIFVGGAILGFHSAENRITLFRAIFIALLIGLVFGFILGLICGVELYPDNGSCSACGGDGIFGSRICPLCGGWG